MKPRRRKGATLGLVAVSVLVIILIGVGVYFLAKIAGGGREVANSTDAGALAVAKTNLRSVAASVPMPGPGPHGYSDFMGCDDPINPGSITLFTYNKAVAQALLVAMNAESQGTAQAYALALWGKLRDMGNSLSTKLNQASTSLNEFTTVANNNSTKMFGGSQVAQTEYNTAFLRRGGSTNVWFSQYTFAQNATDATGNAVSYNFPTAGVPTGLVYSGTLNRPAPANAASNYSPFADMPNAPYQGKFMAGYQLIGPVLGKSFVGVPVFPTQKPHLVSLGEFQDPAKNFADPEGFTPPNTFRVATQSKDAKTTNFGGAVACAIVGAVNQFAAGAPAQSCDFVASLPHGYIVIANAAPAGGAPPNWGVPDNSNSIFNHELNPDPAAPPAGGGVRLSPLGGADAIFFQENDSTARQTVEQWVDYNADGQWTDSSGNTYTTPPTGSLANIHVTHDGNTATNPTAADMARLSGMGSNCLIELVNNNWEPEPHPCEGNVGAMSDAYDRTWPMGSGGSPTSTMQQYWSAVDQIKKTVISAMGARRVTVHGGATSGLGAYDPPRSGGVWPEEPWNTGNPAPLEKANATVMDLINQIGAPCATQAVLRDIWQRCNEIAPGTSYNAMVNLLTSGGAVIHMGDTLFIKKQNPADPKSPLIIGQTAPSYLTTGVPAADGPGSGDSFTCSNNYGLYRSPNSLINSAGDSGVGGRPFPIGGGDINATDHAQFQLSSGNHGLLGKLDFFQTTAGTGSFSRPN
jgi:hypothetical protein